MPLQEFYGSHEINDDNILCGRIIRVDCDLNHTYVDPCELLNACWYNPFIISDHWCEMVSDLWMVAGEILRVNATWDCVESVPLSSIIHPGIFDYKVKVTAWDTEDYLNNQIIWISPIIVDFPAGDVVRISFDPTALPTLPTPPTDCYSVLASQEGTSNYDRVCTPDNFWASRFVHSDYTIFQTSNTVEFDWIVTDVFEWNPDMDFILNADKGIRIVETGMYRVWMAVSSRINRGVKNLRFFVFSVPNSKTILVNEKVWYEPVSAIVREWLTHKYVDMSRWALVKLEAWDVIVLAMRADNVAGTSIDSEIRLFSESLTWGSYGNWSFVGPHSGSWYWCYMVSRNTFNAV